MNSIGKQEKIRSREEDTEESKNIEISTENIHREIKLEETLP